MANIGVIGSGSFGTALTWLLSNNGHRVTLWSHRQETTDLFEKYHENTDKLPGVKLAASVRYTCDLAETVKAMDMLILAVPSSAVRETAGKMKDLVEKDQIIAVVAKGIEESTLLTMTDIVEEVIPQADVAVLSGPTHAEEVGRGMPTMIVAGAHSRRTAVAIQEFCSSPVFRVYTSSDMLGIEIGAALKNVIALAAGTADGMGFGDNTKAALITRGITEISRLGMAMGGKAETFSGLTGIGDLIVTCASVHSRNRRCGFLMGQGKTMEEAVAEVHQVVEGIHSAKAAKKLAEKYNIEMPIVEAVNKVLFENLPASEALNTLMTRVKKDEVSDW
ncbi:MAG: NAD(P)H-dependent glycerol-3-phosphate dehydrogenase [Lachnospiraceae bacterium]|nr:NAD(P)H-dependent glycerol-3-phosphate dehydrogenase [Lachnospiraceae bacterium]